MAAGWQGRVWGPGVTPAARAPAPSAGRRAMYNQATRAGFQHCQFTVLGEYLCWVEASGTRVGFNPSAASSKGPAQSMRFTPTHKRVPGRTQSNRLIGFWAAGCFSADGCGALTGRVRVPFSNSNSITAAATHTIACHPATGSKDGQHLSRFKRRTAFEQSISLVGSGWIE